MPAAAIPTVQGPIPSRVPGLIPTMATQRRDWWGMGARGLGPGSDIGAGEWGSPTFGGKSFPGVQQGKVAPSHPSVVSGQEALLPSTEVCRDTCQFQAPTYGTRLHQ